MSLRRTELGVDGDGRHAVAVTDLVAVVLGAGGTIGESLRVVARHGPESLREPLSRLLGQSERGVPLVDVLVELPEVLGEVYRPLSASLLSAERDGAPVASLLVRLSDETRFLRRRRAEARARQLPVRLLFPLVLCALPAVIVGAILPLVLVSFGRL